MTSTERREGSQRLVVELVGPAGAGKTTLLRLLRAHERALLTDIRLSATRSFPSLLANTLPFVPVFLRRHRHSRWFNRSEIRSMVYLRVWQSALERQLQTDHVAAVLDQGPIFRLALLDEFGPGITRSSAYREWWGNMLETWISKLDVAVWLDAPDDVLLERVRGREQEHPIKAQANGEAREFLSRFRRAYERILDRASDRRDFSVLRFDTSRVTTEGISLEVLRALASFSHEDGRR